MEIKIIMEIEVSNGDLKVNGETVAFAASASYVETDEQREQRWAGVLGRLALDAAGLRA